MVTSGVTDVVAILNLIFNTGGRNVLVVNVPDIGKTPAIQSLGQRGSCRGIATQMSAAYNGALQQQINLAARAARILDPGGRRLHAGCPDLCESCRIRFHQRDRTVLRAAADRAAALPEPNTYLFWDPLHPTYAAGQQLASAALKALGR